MQPREASHSISSHQSFFLTVINAFVRCTGSLSRVYATFAHTILFQKVDSTWNCFHITWLSMNDLVKRWNTLKSDHFLIQFQWNICLHGISLAICTASHSKHIRHTSLFPLPTISTLSMASMDAFEAGVWPSLFKNVSKQKNKPLHCLLLQPCLEFEGLWGWLCHVTRAGLLDFGILVGLWNLGVRRS